jgi:hypothetical protein
VSSEPSVDDSSPALAHAKRIGNDVEDLVLNAIDALEPADDAKAHHDAETVAVITPSTDNDLALGSIAVVEPDQPLVDVVDKTVYRWVCRAAERLHAEMNDVGWSFLNVHDLRRTWGTDLLEQGVLPSVVMDWGGWEDWETFRRHYLGEFSPKAIKRERGKVDYLEGGDSDAEVTHPGLMPADRSAGHLPD